MRRRTPGPRAELEFLALRVWRELDRQGILNSNGDTRRLLNDHRQLRATQNQLAAQLGMTPASRASIRAIANHDKEIDLVGAMAAAQSDEIKPGGTITDAGYNISDDSTCAFAKTGSANNGDNVNPLPSPAGLAKNGGPTQTIALLSGSPAIDAIPVADCTDQSTPPKRITADQRGFPRPDAGEQVCDIGAYEFRMPPVGNLAWRTVTARAFLRSPNSLEVSMWLHQPCISAACKRCKQLFGRSVGSS
jgi:hypothetical protein